MKKIKTLICLLLIISIIAPKTVEAATDENANDTPIIRDRLTKGVTDPNPPPDDSKNSEPGYRSITALKSGKSTLVGFSVTFLQYDLSQDSGNREKVLYQRYYGRAGALAGGSEQYQFTDKWASMDIQDYWDGNKCAGVNKPSKVAVTDVSVSYNGASVEGLFDDNVIIDNSFDFTFGNKNTAATTMEFWNNAFYAMKDVDGYSGILERDFLPSTDTSEIIRTMGLSMSVEDFVKNFETFFFRIEPVYRTYPAVLKEATGSDAIITVGDSGTSLAPANESGYSDEGGEGSGEFHDKYADSGNDYLYSWVVDCPDSAPEGITCTDSAWKDCYYHYSYMYNNFKFEGISTSVSIARKSGNTTNMSTFYSSYLEEQLQVQAMDEHGVDIKDETDCYVGFTYKNAIANAPEGSKCYHKFNSKYNEYLLASTPPTANELKNYQNTTVGMWLVSIKTVLRNNDCVKQCKYIENPDDVTHSSYEYLQCAQSYCEKLDEVASGQYATNAKRNCIVEKCKYKPQTPIDCSNLSEDAQALVDASDAEKSNESGVFTSQCGYVNGGLNKTYTDAVSSYHDCKRYGTSTTIDHNGVDAYPYGTSNVDNTYINVICKENTRLGFYDISQDKIDPGVGYYYPVNMYGNRQCVYFFDTVSWIFDFASTHSLDRVRKRMLLQKVEAFNKLNTDNKVENQINGSNLLGKRIYYDIIDGKPAEELKIVSLDDLEGKLPTSENLKYSTSEDKLALNATTEEYVNGDSYKGGYYFYNNGGDINFDRTDFKESVSLTYNDKTTMTEYNLYKKSSGSNLENDREIPLTLGYVDVNSYRLTSGFTSVYELPRVCIDEHNERVVSLADESGNCASTYYEESSLGLREYYTDLKYKNHDTYNNIVSNSYVKQTDMDGVTNKEESYLSITDTCHYDYEPKISCSLHFDKKEDQCYMNQSVIVGCYQEGIDVSLSVENTTTDKVNVESTTIMYNGENYVNVKQITISTKDPKVVLSDTGELILNNKIEVRGKVTVKDSSGTSIDVPCSGDIDIINTCGNNCSITQDEDDSNKFLIDVNDAEGSEVLVATGLKTDSQDNLLLQKASQDEDGNYYYQTMLRPENEAIIAVISDAEVTEQMNTLKDQRNAIDEELADAKDAIKTAEKAYREYKRWHDQRLQVITANKRPYEAAIKDLEAEKAPLDAQLEDYQKQLASIKSRIQTKKSQIDSKNKQIQEYSGRYSMLFLIEQLRNEIKRLQDEIKNIENNEKTPVETKIAELTPDIQELADKITENQDVIDKYDEEIKTNDATLETKKEAVETAKTAYNAIYQRYLAKKDEIDDLSANMFDNGTACVLEFSCTKDKCIDKFTPDQALKIKEYCELHWQDDLEGYKNSSDCMNHCPNGPCLENSDASVCCERELTEAQRESEDAVVEWCHDHSNGDTNVEIRCVAVCYNQKVTDPHNINFRPINLQNPFPYSKYSDDDSNGYYDGNRKVGVEWIPAHKTIGEDIDEINAGTGIEYKVTLNPSNIRAIIQDTISNNSNLAQDSVSGTILTYTTNGLKVSDGTCASGGYTGFCSKFIHGGDGTGFRSLFSIVRGVANNAGS